MKRRSFLKNLMLSAVAIYGLGVQKEVVERKSDLKIEDISKAVEKVVRTDSFGDKNRQYGDGFVYKPPSENEFMLVSTIRNETKRIS